MNLKFFSSVAIFLVFLSVENSIQDETVTDSWARAGIQMDETVEAYTDYEYDYFVNPDKMTGTFVARELPDDFEPYLDAMEVCQEEKDGWLKAAEIKVGFRVKGKYPEVISFMQKRDGKGETIIAKIGKKNQSTEKDGCGRSRSVYYIVGGDHIIVHYKYHDVDLKATLLWEFGGKWVELEARARGQDKAITVSKVFFDKISEELEE